LFALSFRFDPKCRPEASRQMGEKWTERVHNAAASPRALIVLALTAGLLEVATMFPYLGAIALLAGAGVGAAGIAAVLAGYCLVMVLPVLERLNGWFAKHAVGATGWILGIVGFLLAADAASQLGFLNTWRID
jgi:hypothetical protein